MRTGYLLAQLLKGINTPNNNDRLARAMFVANSCAFAVCIDPCKTWEQAVEDNEKAFLSVLNEVNENVTLDTKLCKAVFRNLIRIRYELMMGGCTPELVQMALQSATSENMQSPEQNAMQDWLTSRNEFAAAHVNAIEALTGHFATAQ